MGQCPSSFVGTSVQFAPCLSIFCMHYKEHICSKMNTKERELSSRPTVSLSGQIVCHPTCHVLPFLNINTLCYSSVIENNQVLVAASISWEGIWVLCSFITKNKARTKNGWIWYLEKFKFWPLTLISKTAATNVSLHNDSHTHYRIKMSNT